MLSHSLFLTSCIVCMKCLVRIIIKYLNNLLSERISLSDETGMIVKVSTLFEIYITNG
jgi:hypothetical protein